MKRVFDDFTMMAEVAPAIIMVLPILVLALCHGALSGEWTEASIEFVIAAALLYFLARVVREWGKSYQEKMYKRLKGMPTTIVMRFSDDRIDEMSKTKYHKRFNDKGEQYQLPMSLDEEEQDTLSDSKYINAVKDLRVYANSNRNDYPRVYQELKKYNYWRNLYGCKKIAVVMYVILIIKEFFSIEEFQLEEVFLNPLPKYSIFWGLIIWTMIYCIFVTKKIVERNAFDYAITLVETVCGTDAMQ